MHTASQLSVLGHFSNVCAVGNLIELIRVFAVLLCFVID